MPINRIIYNLEGLFVGPAPSSGYHFLNKTSGEFHNNPTISNTANLIAPIQRAIGASYDFSVGRAEVKALGYHSTISRPILEAPVVSISFDYHQVGINNEYRMGFYTNYSTNLNSTPYYANNSGVYVLSGFTTKSLNRAVDNAGWPLDYRDKRNLFVAISKTPEDLTENLGARTREIDVIGFGNCYLTSYSTNAAVGDTAKCSVSYIGENMRFYSSGSGIEAPAINYRDGTPTSGLTCVIPSLYEQGLGAAPSAIVPGDINIDIVSYVNNAPRYAHNGAVSGSVNLTKSSDIKNIGLNFQDLRIERYSLSIDLRRETQSALNFKYPSDRRVVFPVYANVEFEILVGDSETGSLHQLVTHDADYDISIRLKHRVASSGVAVRYDLIGSKFQGVSYQTSIGPNKTARLSFTTELDPRNLTRGLFMSGIFYQNPEDNSYLLKEAGDYVLLEDGGKIILDNEVSLII
jgi:hypothetical protein